MQDIKGYDTFSKIEPITKGMSGDKKYRIETVDGKRYLLRVAGIDTYDRKKTEFKVMQQVAALGVPMQQPVDFGVCDNGKNVYTLLTWIDGKEVEAVLPTLTKLEQYALGMKSGEILFKIHTISAPAYTDDWAMQYFTVIDERLDAFKREGVPFEGDATILAFLESNRHLLKGRPQCRHHSDYHEGNMILNESGELFIIDWHTVDFNNYGDPWYEFNRIGTEFPAFASGQIDGYFHGKPPKEFWTLLAYYLAASAITSIVWAKYYMPERLNAILQLNADVLRWFDNFQNPVPTWYLTEQESLNLKTKPQSWSNCDETIHKYINGLIDLFMLRLGENLVGIYLHGSLAMGSYFPPKSDIDLLIVVNQSIEADFAKELNLSIAGYAEKRPTVGSIELSVITLETAQTVPIEIPYELHYSEMWHQRILDNQVEYGKHPIDPDLPAHLMCVKKRGVCLYGKPINKFFGKVNWHNFMLAVLDDFDWIVANENICESPYYCILNICRVLQSLQENNQKILSKYEGGIWGINSLPSEYLFLIQKALAVYSSDTLVNEDERKTGGVSWDKSALLAFRDYARLEREALI